VHVFTINSFTTLLAAVQLKNEASHSLALLKNLLMHCVSQYEKHLNIDAGHLITLPLNLIIRNIM